MMSRARDMAAQVVARLRGAGYGAYFAGGCVRDEILGLEPKDYDVASDARPDEVGRVFRGAREVGKAFGVMLVREGGVTVEVTTFRREGAYSDRRRPDEVEFADIHSDAQRRDFTMNALYIDPEVGAAGQGLPVIRVDGVRGGVIDLVRGLDDLRARMVRAVGNPDARLAEDDLRALRAVRFAARLGFTIEEGTRRAIVRHAGGLGGISRERIGEELRMMLRHPARSDAARLLEELALDGPTLEEPGLDEPAARRDHRAGDLSVLASLPANAEFALAASAWMIDRLSRGTGVGVAQPGVLEGRLRETLGRWRRSLCLSNDERDSMAAILEGMVALETRFLAGRVAFRKRVASSGWFEPAMHLVRARQALQAGRIEADVAALSGTPGGLAPAPWVSGDALVAAGALPGPGFGKWLEAVYDAQLEGRVGGPEEALELGLRLSRGEDPGVLNP